MKTATKFTYDDLRQTPRDSSRYELVDGELFVTPAPIPLHQIVVGNLYAELRAYVRQHRLGVVFHAPCDIVFSSTTVLEPDVFFVSNSRLNIIGKKNLSGPPDLVVEVLSESTARLDREIKLKKYALHAVPDCWLLELELKIVEVFRLNQGEYELIERRGFRDALTSPLFPGLSLLVSSLWEPM